MIVHKHLARDELPGRVEHVHDFHQAVDDEDLVGVEGSRGLACQGFVGACLGVIPDKMKNSCLLDLLILRVKSYLNILSPAPSPPPAKM